MTTALTSRRRPAARRPTQHQILRDFLAGHTIRDIARASGCAVMQVEAVIRRASLRKGDGVMSKKATARKAALKEKAREARVPPTAPKKKQQVKKGAWRALPSIAD